MRPEARVFLSTVIICGSIGLAGFLLYLVLADGFHITDIESIRYGIIFVAAAFAVSLPRVFRILNASVTRPIVSVSPESVPLQRRSNRRMLLLLAATLASFTIGAILFKSPRTMTWGSPFIFAAVIFGFLFLRALRKAGDTQQSRLLKGTAATEEVLSKSGTLGRRRWLPLILPAGVMCASLLAMIVFRDLFARSFSFRLCFVIVFMASVTFWILARRRQTDPLRIAKDAQADGPQNARLLILMSARSAVWYCMALQAILQVGSLVLFAFLYLSVVKSVTWYAVIAVASYVVSLLFGWFLAKRAVATLQALNVLPRAEY